MVSGKPHMAGTTKSSKKDLEAKIAALEEKLAKLSSQFESRPQTTASPPPAPQTQVLNPIHNQPNMIQ